MTAALAGLGAVAVPATAQTTVAMPDGGEGVGALPVSKGPCARSPDGRWRMIADTDAPRLRLLDAAGRLQREWRVATLDGSQASAVAAVHHSASRQSFVIALRDVAELWEISLDSNAAPIHDGLVHDYRMGEALATPGLLGVRRTPLPQALQDFRLDPGGHWAIGIATPVGGRQGRAATDAALELVHLDARRHIARLPLQRPVDLDRLGFASVCGRAWLSVADETNGASRWFSLAAGSVGQPMPAPGGPSAPACQPPV